MSNKEKILGIIDSNKVRKIAVTHVTIRQSISILLLRLVVLEALAASGVIIFHSLIISTNVSDLVSNASPYLTIFNIPIFLLLIILKTLLMIYIILQWLYEYYEITPREVIHRKGLFFKKEEFNVFKHLSSLEIDQGILGKLFNCGTIKLFNWTTEKNIYLYLIHNPMKYHFILQTLLPEADQSKQLIRENLIEPERL